MITLVLVFRQSFENRSIIDVFIGLFIQGLPLLLALLAIGVKIDSESKDKV